MAGFVSAVSWIDSQNNPHLRVYTSNGQTISEQAYDGSWYAGAFSAPGTTVGATSWLDSSGQIHLRVYVATKPNDGPIVEYAYDDSNGWYTGAFQANGIGAAPTSWLDQQGQIHIRVYVRAANGTVTEYAYDGGAWYVGSYPGAIAVNAPQLRAGDTARANA